MTTDNINLQSKLEKELQKTHWQDLHNHALEDRLILVDNQLDLIKAAVEVASDNSQVVSDWMNDNLVRKPSKEEIETWNSNKNLEFQFIIVQPFVLAQSLAQ